MRSRIAGVGGTLVFAWAMVALSADIPDNADSKSIDESIAGYSQAYNDANIDALGTFWAEDCDFVDHRGRRYSGRDEIKALFRRALVEGPGYQLKLNVTARRFLRDDLAIDDGSLELTEPSGEVETGRYVTVWAKVEGKWVIQNARDMPSDPDSKTAGQNPLNNLQFLVGNWTLAGAEGAPPVTVACDWQAGGKFLVQEFSTAAAEGSEPFTVTVWIGYDPIAGHLRSWYFDSSGGFGSADWLEREDGWSAATSGVLPDGRTTTSDFHWGQGDDGAIVMTLMNAEVAGEVLADSEVRYVRQQ
ncbi:MAG: SgcJ/EcaC family oxidoreductase [Planctomycetaceae bacterium]|nr:SgcJ/EcaC family oxidoreductase [Planctomycetaceae bacterium]